MQTNDESILHKSIATFSQKNIFPEGIRTRIICSCGGCDDYCDADISLLHVQIKKRLR
jgi:hypothetical protein